MSGWNWTPAAEKGLSGGSDHCIQAGQILMAIELKKSPRSLLATHIHATSLKLEEGRFNILLGTTLSGKPHCCG